MVDRIKHSHETGKKSNLPLKVPFWEIEFDGRVTGFDTEEEAKENLKITFGKYNLVPRGDGWTNAWWVMVDGEEKALLFKIGEDEDDQTVVGVDRDELEFFLQDATDVMVAVLDAQNNPAMYSLPALWARVQVCITHINTILSGKSVCDSDKPPAPPGPQREGSRGVQDHSDHPEPAGQSVTAPTSRPVGGATEPEYADDCVCAKCGKLIVECGHDEGALAKPA